MDCRKLNQIFNVDGPDSLGEEEYDIYQPFNTVAEQQHAWYIANKERILLEQKHYLKVNADEVNRRRRERRNTEPYRSQYLARQRERRRATT